MAGKPISIALLLALLVGGVLFLIRRGGGPEAGSGAGRPDTRKTTGQTPLHPALKTGTPIAQPGSAESDGRPHPGTNAGRPTPAGETHPRAITPTVGGLTWPQPIPASGAAKTATPGKTAKGEPAIPTKLAFRALWYLGTDPAAEKTWLRAINDPNTPPGVRSDLIEDMEDEGYSDNGHPTKKDLPIILARLELIERYAPYALDEVNAKAFEIAYRRLLDLYVRLGGKPKEGNR